MWSVAWRGSVCVSSRSRRSSNWIMWSRESGSARWLIVPGEEATQHLRRLETSLRWHKISFLVPAAHWRVFLFNFLFILFLRRLAPRRCPPHVGSAGLFCPQNSAEICSSPNQMAAFTRSSVTPVPHHMTRRVREPAQPPPHPPNHSKTGALLQGGSSPAASQVPEEKQIFIFSQSKSRLGELLKDLAAGAGGGGFRVQIYSLWNSSGQGRVTGRRPASRRDGDQAVQTFLPRLLIEVPICEEKWNSRRVLTHAGRNNSQQIKIKTQNRDEIFPPSFSFWWKKGFISPTWPDLFSWTGDKSSWWKLDWQPKDLKKLQLAKRAKTYI